MVLSNRDECRKPIRINQGQYRQPENFAQPIVFHMHMDLQKGPIVNIQESEQTIPTYANTKKMKLYGTI